MPEPVPSLSDLPEKDFDELGRQQQADLVEVRIHLARCADYLQGIGRDLASQRTGYAEPQCERPRTPGPRLENR